MNQGTKKITIGEIINENAQIKADIATFIAVITDVFKSLGLNMEEFGETKDMMQILGKVLPKLTLQMSTGGFNGDAFAKLKEVMPIIERYKHLAPGLNEPN